MNYFSTIDKLAAVGCVIIILTIFGLVYYDNKDNPSAIQPPPKQPAIIIKMDYETVKRIDARLDAIDGVLTINGLIPAK